jgi:uncharacterized repeat protein (TIGR01451 family)
MSNGRHLAVVALALSALLAGTGSPAPASGDLVSLPRHRPFTPPLAAPPAVAPAQALPANGSLVTIGLNFQGSELDVDSGFVPPDTMGAVGPNHVVEIINGRFEVYDKITGFAVVSTSLDFFWSSIVGVTIPLDSCVSNTCSVSGTACTSSTDCVSNFTFDPRIVFDHDSQRWFVLALDGDLGAGNNIYLARTDTADPTGDWDGLRFAADTVGAVEFHDYETLGVDADGLYSCTQDFNGGGNESCYSIPKADLLAAVPSIANLTRFEATPAGLPTVNGSIQPALDFGPSDGRAALLGANAGALVRSDILGAGGAGATLGTVTAIAGDPGHAAPPAARQPHPAGRTIENVAPRVVANVFEEGDSLWAVHAVQGTGSNSALRWYEIDETTNTVLQTGLIEDTAQDFHEPSIAANALGKVVIGYTCSGPMLNPSVCVSVGETTLGVTTFDAPLIVQNGAGYYWRDSADPPDSERNRWGDYSATVRDPIDDCTFWIFQEFVAVGAVGNVGPWSCDAGSPAALQGQQCSVDGDCGGGNCVALAEGGAWGVEITEMTFDDCADANLVITKADAPDPVVAGLSLTYTLNVQNLGPSRAYDVMVTDTLPAGVQFVPTVQADWSCVHAAGTVTCSWQGGNPVGSLAANQAANPITITVDVDPSTLGQISNTATVSSTTPDSVAPNTVQEDTTVIAEADLAVLKNAMPDPVFAGGILQFDILIENKGPSDAQNVQVSENTPSQTKFLSVEAPPGWTCVTPPVSGTGMITCTTATLPAGAVAAFVIKVSVDGAVGMKGVTNTITIASDTTDPEPRNDSSVTETVTILPVPLLSHAGMALAVLVLLIVVRHAWLSLPGRRQDTQ